MKLTQAELARLMKLDRIAREDPGKLSTADLRSLLGAADDLPGMEMVARMALDRLEAIESQSPETRVTHCPR